MFVPEECVLHAGDLPWVQDKARACHEKGMTPEEVVRGINLGRFAQLDEHARTAQNVLAVYYERDRTRARVDTIEMFRREGPPTRRIHRVGGPSRRSGGFGTRHPCRATGRAIYSGHPLKLLVTSC